MEIKFSLVKAHAVIYGNEIADRLDKEAARSKDTETAINKTPISTLYYELEKETNLTMAKNGENAEKHQ